MAESKFDKLKGKLSKRRGVSNPGALAAYIGREKYGEKGMMKKSEAGKRKERDARLHKRVRH